jgi:hypothetical protein
LRAISHVLDSPDHEATRFGTPQFKTAVAGTLSSSGFASVGATWRTEMTSQQFLKVRHSGDFLFLFVTSYSLGGAVDV